MRDELQLTFLPLNKEEELLSELSSTKKNLDKLRRGVFSRHTDIARDVIMLKDKLESLQVQFLMLEGYVRKFLKKECE